MNENGVASHRSWRDPRSDLAEKTCASDSPLMLIVEVPGLRIERHREQSPYTGEATDAQLAENLASEIGPHALATAGLHRPARWFVEAVALPQRPSGVSLLYQFVTRHCH
jgi:hypothetical protein